jgi:hypothetical protein
MLGFCYGVKHSWNENRDPDLFKSSIHATAYGLWGAMWGAVGWCIMSALIPVVGATYFSGKLF